MKAIILDFDGTIADTIPAITEGVNLAMRALNLPEHTEEEVKGFINNGSRELIRGALPEEFRRDEAFVDHALTVYIGEYQRVYFHTNGPYPGIPELLRDLHREGYRVGVLSNKREAMLADLCRNILLPGSYDATSGAEAGKPTKPDRYMTDKLMARLGTDPADCVMVGDSDVDVRTAANAGMRHIGVTWGYRSAEFLRRAGATDLAGNAGELRELIRSRYPFG